MSYLIAGVEEQEITNWEVMMLDPRGGTRCFANYHVTPEYTSYYEVVHCGGGDAIYWSGRDLFVCRQSAHTSSTSVRPNSQGTALAECVFHPSSRSLETRIVEIWYNRFLLEDLCVPPQNQKLDLIVKKERHTGDETTTFGIFSSSPSVLPTNTFVLTPSSSRSISRSGKATLATEFESSSDADIERGVGRIEGIEENYWI
ncbi:hypothetical protein DFJ43DRAFT_1037080 [Lentinula guzmanii]|uniref:Uncharacterized protein n=1 Tax=Lentinula guzmanii TaxID=2804957 RepID=A0AA38JHE9_9AGAR|nr:hypothetical protein DFJ43DRAFT_1037080 [Lentinula guzmanii]